MFSKIANNQLIRRLTDYACALNKQIYVVGGAVRDAIIGVSRISNVDVDIASTLAIDEVIIFATQNQINYEIKNRKLEVVALLYEDKCYEIARLRREVYLSNFSHTPNMIAFTDDVVEDAKRRDFTANSVYYVTHSNTLVDPFGGIQDIKEKRLKTVLSPEETLSVDPARIIRMVELSARFNFEIDDETMSVAKKYAGNINKLTKQRLKKELERLYQVNKYDGENELGYMQRVNTLFNKLDMTIKIWNIL